MKLVILSVVSASVLALTSPARAATTTATVDLGSASSPVAFGTFSFPYSLTLPKFNSNLGTLDSMTLTLTAEQSHVSCDLLNLSSVAQPYTDAMTVPFGFHGLAPHGEVVAIDLPGTGPFSGVTSSLFMGFTLAGTTTFGSLTDSVNVASSSFATYESNGGGTFSVAMQLSSTNPVGSVTNGSLYASMFGDTYGNLAVTYSYTPIPEPATCAAGFGAAALGFAIWRRRRAA